MTLTRPTTLRERRILSGTLIGAWLSLTLMNCVSAATGIVSKPTRASASGSGGSFTPIFSADGRSMAFVSQARNLTTNDIPGPRLNVFVRNLGSSHTALASLVPSDERVIMNADANSAAISSNGQFVAFDCVSSFFLSNAPSRVSRDVYLRDLLAGTTTLVSVDLTGTNRGNGFSSVPLISADGTRVVFESAASNLVANDTNVVTDVFVRDLVARATTLVSGDVTEAGNGVGRSELGSMSLDGRYIAFVKRASNLVNGAVSMGEVYIRDLLGTTVWASKGVASHFIGMTNVCFNPAISADGATVVFQAAEARGSFGNARVVGDPVLLFRFQAQTGVAELISSNASVIACPAVNADGRFIAYAGTNALHIFDGLAGTNRVIRNAGTAQFDKCLASAITPDGARVTFIASVSNQFGVYVQDWATGDTFPVSLSTNGTLSSPVIVSTPAISPDGRFVAFESTASDLVADDFNQASDIFVRDLTAGMTTLLSQRTPSRPTATGFGLMTLSPGAVSADGRVIAFASLDNELTDGDTNRWEDVFVRDSLSGTTVNISARTAIEPPTANHTSEPQLSADGRYLAYLQQPILIVPTNICWVDLATGIPQRLWANSGALRQSSPRFAMSLSGRYLAFADRWFQLAPQIFVRDMFDPASTNIPITTNWFDNGFGNADSTDPTFSPDERWLAFVSLATTLTPNAVPPSVRQLYVRDLMNNQTRLVSYDVNGAGLQNGVLDSAAVFSADARFLIFRFSFSSDMNLIYRHDLLAGGPNTVVCSNGLSPSVSADGRFVAYEIASPGTTLRQIVVTDLEGRQTKQAGIDFAPFSSPPISRPLLSYDGHYVVFTSVAGDLALNDLNGARDVFVHDLWAGATLLVSMNTEGTGSGNALSTTPVLAADGRTVLFQSFASDLVPGDYNDTRDIFVLRLGGPDTDGDGMEDDWEMAYFNTLAREGTGDFDGDGCNDSQEFRSGTDPANDASVLRVLTLRVAGGNSTTVLWAATPGRTYRVQFKNAAEDAGWTDLEGDMIAGGTTGSKVDVAATSIQRFYRVRLVE